MQELIQYQTNLLLHIKNQFRRYLFEELPWHSRFLAIKGLRGVGKTTMMLQYLKYELKDLKHHLYVTMDHPYFYDRSLFHLADEFYRSGGKVLLVDEVHKYKEWSKEIKLIFDSFPSLQVIVSASSTLDLMRGDADLSRRLLVYELGGLSFREYMILKHNKHLPKHTISEVLHNHEQIVPNIVKEIHPLPYFKEYLQRGYFPIGRDESQYIYQKRLHQVIELTLTQDLNYINGHSADMIHKLKKLLGVLAETSPFTINVSSVAQELNLGRNTIKTLLHELEAARMLNFLSREGKGISTLQKPDKIYLENTNFSYTLKPDVNIGTIRETFVINQVRNTGLQYLLPPKGDIIINDKYILEIGGRNKTKEQIKGLANAYILKDDIEVGYDNVIPLWVIGLMY